MSLVGRVFPKYAAASVQMGVHAAQAANFAKAAAQAPALGERLDNAVRASNSFDHAITASKELPVRRLVPNAGKYYAGYQATKAVVGLIVGSGLVPGAAARVGRNEIAAARDEYTTGVSSYQASHGTRFERFRALDWMNAALEDASQGVRMLKADDIARPLLQGIDRTRSDIRSKRELDPAQVRAVQDLLGRATTAFDAIIAEASQAASK